LPSLVELASPVRLEVMTMTTMPINWKRAVLAGIAGTLVFDLFGLLVIGQWWDVPELLGAKMGLGLAAGVVGHFANGILLAVIYAAISPSLWGPGWVRALTYMTLETVFGVWLFMLPLAGAGVAGLGLGLGILVPLMTLVRHWLFGLVLAWLYPSPRPQAVPSAQAASAAL
jgi:hypothetical protein